MSQSPPGVEYASLLIALVNIVISLPLVLRRVPPNYFYGFRTRKTLSSPDIWYEANYIGGRGLIIASSIAVLLWPVVMALLDRGVATFVNIAIIVIATSLALGYSLGAVRRL